MSKLIEIVNNPLLLDVKAGITAAKNEAIDTTKFLVNDVAIPIISVILAGVLLFAIAKCVKKHRDGDDYSKNIIDIYCKKIPNKCNKNILFTLIN